MNAVLKYANHHKDTKRKPWIIQEIIDLIEARNNAYKNYLNCLSDLNFTKFKLLRNKVNLKQKKKQSKCDESAAKSFTVKRLKKNRGI